MDLGIRGRTALVTGSSQGIGRAVAEALAREGAHVGLAARGEALLEMAARELGQAHGVRAIAVPCDLSRPDAIPPMVGAVRAALGPIDILVTNAGGPPSGPFERIDDGAWRQTFELTLMSVVRLCREALPEMRSRGWGRIIHLTSVSVKQPLPQLVLSNSLRSAVAGLSKTLAEESAAAGITVNCVGPGFTATDRLAELASATARGRGASEDEVRAGWLAAIPARRLGQPAEIADLVAFLASDRAAYITGSFIAVDGGLCRGLL